jgi:glycosyltransferase involved in cell wall biosynthesis
MTTGSGSSRCRPVTMSTSTTIRRTLPRVSRSAIRRLSGVRGGRSPRVLLIVENVSLARDHRLRKQVGSLLGRGYAVSVICRSDPDNRPAAGSRLREYRAPADGASKLGFVREYGYSWLMAAWLTARVFASEGFDAIQISGTPDIYFAIGAPFKLLGKPLVLDQRDLSPELYEARYGDRGPMYRVLCGLERLSWRAADHVVTVNDSLETAVCERGGLARDSVTVVRNGPLLASTVKRQPQTDLKRGRRFLACWLGLMGPQDHVDVALRAIHHLVHVTGRTDCQFAFIGDGEARPDLERLAVELGIAGWTSFPGWLGEEEAFTYLSSADLGLEPNLDPMVSPVKCMEFMAFGLPTVAFDLTETKALAGDAAVYAVRADAVDFARLIDGLLGDPRQRTEMGREGRRRVEERECWERQEVAYVGVFDRLLGGGADHVATVGAEAMVAGGEASRAKSTVDGEASKADGSPATRHTAAQRLRHRTRTLACEHPALYLPFARRKYPGPSPEVIGPRTEVVFEGYTRAAMTFAVYAFQLSQAEPVRMAHHLHAPAQAIAAARRGLPTLVLIREPRGAILSQVVREPHVALPDALYAYARYYERLLPYRSAFAVADFEDVTADFGAVTRRFNERFGTAYAEFVPSEANIQECLELVKLRGTMSTSLLGFESGLVTLDVLRFERDRLARRREPGAAGEAWVPSPERERAKEALREQWLAPSYAGLRERAERAYAAFLDDTDRPAT